MPSPHSLLSELNSFQAPKPSSFSTRAIHVGQEPEQWNSRATVPPIHHSVTYVVDDQTKYKYSYASEGNPTRDVLQSCFAKLEGANHCLTFPSGSSATTCVFHLLRSGDHLLLSKHLYGGTYTLAKNIFEKYGITVDSVDFLNLAELKAALKTNTRMVFFETPTNPCLRIVDIQAVSSLVHSFDDSILVVCDNTFLTPYFQRPISLGVDICVYSMTKYINGHTDVIMGACTLDDEFVFDQFNKIQMSTGIVPSPHDCSMVIRSLKTLNIRMDAHFRNALIVAKFLESHPAVEKVHHPALLSHPDHDLAVKQASGHSGIVSFWLRNASANENQEFLRQLRLIYMQGSLGGVESIASTPLLLSAANQPKDCREDIGVTENLVRLSIGIEDPDDLIQDLNQALNRFLLK